MKHELINGKCYEIKFSKKRKLKSGKIIYPKNGTKAFPFKIKVDPCHCKS